MHDVKKKIIRQPSTDSNGYYGLNLSNQGIRSLSTSIFSLVFLRELHMENNQLTSIPSGIKYLCNLEILNISKNRLKSIPSDLSKLINLKYLYLSYNFISGVPMELGSLYNLEILDLDNNPLLEPFSSIYLSKNGLGIIKFCRENNTKYLDPIERCWIEKEIVDAEKISVGTYNILCAHYANNYNYVPSWILHWENRSEMILNKIVDHNLDILTIQEMETNSFIEKFRDVLEQRCSYDSLFYPKGRSRGMNENERLAVDGCATFWKKHKYTLVDQKCVEYSKIILNDNRFKTNDDIINRNIGRDNISLITVLEKNTKEKIIVVNAHLHWDPDKNDIKVLQTMLLLEEIENIKNKYGDAGIIVCGDFNSERYSAVYNVITNRNRGLKDRNINVIEEFKGYNYAPVYNFSHNLRLYDSYKDYELELTSYTPRFKGILDYIFHNDSFMVQSLLSGVDNEYIDNIIGLPTLHYPSDHIMIAVKFVIKKDKK